MILQSEVLVNASQTLSDAKSTTVELFKSYPDGLLKFATAAGLIIMIIGIPGNIITILALARYKKVLNATAIFIINLSFSDLLFCFNISFAASVYHHRAWVHGQIFCQISLFARYTLFINSFFSIFAITINRYILIAHPKSYLKIYKKRNIIIMLVCTWMLSIALITPIVFKVNDRFEGSNKSCSSQSRDHSKIYLKKVIFLIAFILPSIAMIFCYARIFCIVRNATKSNKKSLNTGKLVNIEKEGSSSDAVTSETSCNYISEQCPTASTNISSRNTNSTVRSSKMEKSDNIVRQTENIEKEPPRIHRTKLQKSIKFLKNALPTQKDRCLGTMIIAIIMSFCLCHIPIVIIKVFLTKNLEPKLSVTSHILFFLSFSINPLIYVVISKEYRKAYKNLFKSVKVLLSKENKKSNVT